MSYAPPLAAALSGATPRQLSYWRRARGGRPVLVPEVSASRPILYSFRDVVALRACVYLRESVSLQKVRRALDSLERLGEVAHLSEYRLVAEAGSIALVRGPEEAIDLVQRPGQQVVAVMADVLGAFNAGEHRVPDLYNPRERITIDPEVRGGRPVVAGTRVPYELVAELVSDGVPAAEVSDYYPSVTEAAALDALDFARYVSSYSGDRAA